MNNEQERADFEAWHKREMWDGGYEYGHDEFYPDAYRFNERLVYENTHTQIAWRGYQAGRAALQSQHETQLQVWRSTDSCGEFWSWDEVDQYDYDHALPENRRVILIIKEG